MKATVAGEGPLERRVGRRPPKRATTPIGYAVHVHGTSAVFDDSVTQVLVDDDAAGPYIVLKQIGREANKAGEVRLDLDELEAVIRAARRLLRAQPEIVD